MEAIQASTGESRPVVKERRGVAWCPFCDRSRQVETTGPICEGCGVEFVDAAPAPVVEEVVAEVVEEDAAYQDDKAVEPPKRRRNK
jgi:ribosomal protein L37AE/L43A